MKQVTTLRADVAGGLVMTCLLTASAVTSFKVFRIIRCRHQQQIRANEMSQKLYSASD